MLENKKDSLLDEARKTVCDNLMKMGLSADIISRINEKIYLSDTSFDSFIAYFFDKKQAKIQVGFEEKYLNLFREERIKDGSRPDFLLSSYFLGVEQYVLISENLSIDFEEYREGYGESFFEQLSAHSFITSIKKEGINGFSFILDLQPFYMHVGRTCDITRLFTKKLPMWGNHIDPKITVIFID